MLFFKVILQEEWCEGTKETFLDVFPGTIYSFRKFLSFDQNCFVKYVVCLKCNSLYHTDECLVLHDGETRSKLCTFVKYPNHPKNYFTQKYGQVLMKEVKAVSGKKIFCPVRIFCYRSIKESLRFLLLRPGFKIECEKWRSQNHSEDVLADVYDGEIWKNFTHDGTNLFFRKPRNYGVMLNVNWFHSAIQTFKQFFYWRHLFSSVELTLSFKI